MNIESYVDDFIRQNSVLGADQALKQGRNTLGWGLVSLGHLGHVRNQ